MAIETPSHVHYLGILIDGQLAHVPVAILAVQARGNVRPMDEMHKVRHLGNRHPVNGLVILYVICELGQFRALHRDLLVAAPAFCLGGNARRRAAQRARMAVQTLNSETYVEIMRKLDGLLGRFLRLNDSPHHSAENGEQCDEHSNPAKRLVQRIEHSFDHGCS